MAKASEALDGRGISEGHLSGESAGIVEAQGGRRDKALWCVTAGIRRGLAG